MLDPKYPRDEFAMNSNVAVSQDTTEEKKLLIFDGDFVILHDRPCFRSLWLVESVLKDRDLPHFLIVRSMWVSCSTII